MSSNATSTYPPRTAQFHPQWILRWIQQRPGWPWSLRWRIRVNQALHWTRHSVLQINAVSLCIFWVSYRAFLDDNDGLGFQLWVVHHRCSTICVSLSMLNRESHHFLWRWWLLLLLKLRTASEPWGCRHTRDNLLVCRLVGRCAGGTRTHGAKDRPLVSGAVFFRDRWEVKVIPEMSCRRRVNSKKIHTQSNRDIKSAACSHTKSLCSPSRSSLLSTSSSLVWLSLWDSTV